MANKGQSNIIGKGFNNRPENINRKGRPRTTVKTLLDELSKKGYKTMTKEDIKLLYLSLLDNSQEELMTLTSDKDTSMIIRVVAKSILDKKGFDIIERMLNRAVGTPTQMMGEDSDNKFTSLADVLIKARNNMLKNE